jgi:glycerol-3-phosphate dehydrogenase
MDAAPHVAVIGGGITGTATARDLGMRGFDVTLVERDRLAAGTSGSMHGLLHSGARYAVSDPTTATACIRENRVIRDIAPHCVTPTGGLFVKRPEDSDQYLERKLEACASCDIPTDVRSGRDVRDEEPKLSADIERAIAVPDAVVDPISLVGATAASAQEHGVRIQSHATVTDVIVEDATVTGIVLDEHRDGDESASESDGASKSVSVDHVVNAAGPWAGRVAGYAGVDLDLAPTRGAMAIVDERLVDTVINRCRPKGDGDIVVPFGESVILGTTAEPVEDPDDYPREAWEVDRLVELLRAVVPEVGSHPVDRSFWGVRPLYDPGPDDASDDDTTRAHVLLDHQSRDNLEGLTSIVGGKLTTHRLMAEDVGDHLCERFGLDVPCRTAEVRLPGREDHDTRRAYMSRFDLPSPTAFGTSDR